MLAIGPMRDLVSDNEHPYSRPLCLWTQVSIIEDYASVES